MLPDYLQTYLRNPLICPPHLWHLIDDPQATFTDLLLDALARVELALLIEERTGRDVPDETYEAWDTLEDLAQAAAWFEGVLQ